ncbi:hypothetical protein EON82_24690 [bacterium]|nr:MAG: hypothetical protein EON82_24690 [bacterium]
MFACVQLDKSVIARRGTIEGYYTGGALVTLAGVVIWIGSMLRAERNQQRKEDLGGQPGGA